MTARTASAPLMRVDGLELALGPSRMRSPVLQGLAFDAMAGEFISVVGPSGCGKTTLLMCLAGLMLPDAGQITFDGAKLRGPADGIGVVFQDYSRSLLPWKSNLANVVFGMRRLGMGRAQRDSWGHELLESVGLRGYENHYPWQVSGGMQQRVAIARGLASRSRLLLLDEPLAAVDAQTRADMQDLVLALAARYRQTCVLVTHDVDEAVYLADRVVVLSARPTHVQRTIDVPLPKPRDQLTTREDPLYLRLRHEVLSLIRGQQPAAAENAAQLARSAQASGSATAIPAT